MSSIIRIALVLSISAGLILATNSTAQALGALNLDVIYPNGTSVAAGAKVDLNAQMPVVGAGTVEQSIEQVIDPTQLKLTSAADITYPVGWTLSVSFDGTSFTQSLPTTSTGTATSWDKVVKVRATGPVVSEGSENGMQIAAATSTKGVVAPVFGSVTSSAGGDGVQAFFDPGYTRVFTVNHKATGEAVMCYRLSDGANCLPGGAKITTAASNSTNSHTYGVIVKDKLWQDSASGMVCTDLGPMMAGTGVPQPCAVGTVWSGRNFSNQQAGFTPQPTAGSWSDLKLWALDYAQKTAYCTDTATMSTCGTINTGTYLAGSTAGRILASGGKFYMAEGNAGAATVNCAVQDGSGPCPGWSTTPRSIGSKVLFELPDANGNVIAVCAGEKPGTGAVYLDCWDPVTGATITTQSSPLMASFKTLLAASANQTNATNYVTMTRTDSRIAWGQGSIMGTSAMGIRCWDAELNNGTGGDCNPNHAMKAHYTVTPDPQIKSCMWVVDHNAPIITTINLANPGTGSTSNSCAGLTKPAVSTFGADVAIPRMACQSPSPITQWRSLSVTTPTTGYSKALFTIFDESGTPIPGWTSLPLTQATTTYSLIGLSTAETGQRPTFEVRYLDAVNGTTFTPQIRISAVGEAPELCVRPTAAVSCPPLPTPAPALGFWPSSIPATTSLVTASGSATDAQSNITGVGPATKTVSIAGSKGAACGGQISGKVYTGGYPNRPFAGVIVSLLSSTGAVVNDASGKPITATTDANGEYTFGNLAPGSYKVKFNNTDVARTEYVDTGAGVAGTNVSGQTSGAITVVQQQTDIVNAPINNLSVARADTSVGSVNQTQTIDVIANDSPSYATPTPSPTINLCSSGSSGCNVKTTTVAGQGTYSVVNQTVVFVPVAGFTGNATPVYYQYNDGRGSVTGYSTSTISVTVIGASSAAPDSSTGEFGMAQSAQVIANDAPVSGTTMDPTSVRLCGPGESAPNCTKYSINRAGEGTYTSSADGSIVFTPADGYYGTPSTPVTYIARDSAGGPVTSTYTPSVAQPTVVAPTADGGVGLQGLPLPIYVLANDIASPNSNFATSGYPVKLCNPDDALPCRRTAAVVSGQGVYTVDAAGIVTFTPCNTSAGDLTVSGVTYAAACTGTPFTGAATPLTYTATDLAGRFASSVITPTIASVPVLTTDAVTTVWNTVKVITPLANDVAGAGTKLDPASVKLCVTSVAAASCNETSLTVADQGTYTVSDTGIVGFTPVASFAGVATPVQYIVQDVLGQRSSSTITATVTSTAPTAVNGTTTVIPGSSATFTTLTGASGMATSSGPAFNTSQTFLCAVSPAPESAPHCTATSVTMADGGLYTLNQSTGVVSYASPVSASPGPQSAVTYVVKDMVGGTASATLTPQVPAAPVLAADTNTSSWDTVQTVSVLTNDSASSAALVKDSVRLCAATDTRPNCTATMLEVPGEGTYTVNADGTVSFDPLPNFAANAQATATPVRYSVTDGIGMKSTTTITLTVNPPADPVAANDTKPVLPGTSVTFAKLMGAGGLSSSGGPALMSVCLLSGNPLACDSDGVVTIPGEGTYTLNATTNVVTYAPLASFNGTPTVMTYQVTDALGHTDTGTLTPVVPPLPSATNDISQGEQGSPQNIAPTGNDSAGDPNSPINPGSVKICALGTSPCTTSADVVVANEGTYHVNADGTVTFTPLSTFVGATSGIAYTVTDVLGRAVSAKITPTVLAKPAPVAYTDAKSGVYGTAIVFLPLTSADASAADTPGTNPGPVDMGGGVTRTISNLNLDASTLKLCGVTQTPAACDKTSVTTADGTYTLNADGTVTFMGNSTFTGTATQPVQYQVSNRYTVTDSGSTPVAGSARTASAYLIPTVNVPALSSMADAKTTAWNTPATQDVLANDTGASIDASTLKLCGPVDTAPYCTQTSVVVTGQGTYEVVSGMVKFTPLVSFTGQANAVTYSATDALGRIVSNAFVVMVNEPNGPSATPDAKSVLAGGTVDFKKIASSGLLVSAGANPIVDAGACIIDPATGSCDVDDVVVTPDGTYTLDPVTLVVSFTANPNAVGGVKTSIRYQVVDAFGKTATSQLTPTVYAKPSVQRFTDIDLVNVDQTFHVLAGSAHDASTTLQIANVYLCDPLMNTAPNCTETHVNAVQNGAVVGSYALDRASGVVTFSPAAGFIGVAPTVTYSATDGLGQRTSNEIAPVVVAPPTPVATDDSQTGVFGSTVVFQLDLNDTASTGPNASSVTHLELDVTSVRLCDAGETPRPSGAGCTAMTLTTADGTYTVDPRNGSVTFAPVNGFVGATTVPVRYEIANTYLTAATGSTPQQSHSSAYLFVCMLPPAPAPAPAPIDVPPAHISPAAPGTPAESTSSGTAPARPTLVLKKQVPAQPLRMPARLTTGTEMNLLALNLITNAGRRVHVAVTCRVGANTLIDLGEIAAACRTWNSGGYAKVWASGDVPVTVKVVLWAKKKKGYTAYREVKTYRIT